MCCRHYAAPVMANATVLRRLARNDDTVCAHTRNAHAIHVSPSAHHPDVGHQRSTIKNVGNLKKVLDNFSAQIRESAAISRKRPLADRQRLVEAAIRRKARTEMVRAVR